MLDGYRAPVFEFGNDGPTVILVGIDGSDTSMRAGAYAAGLARRQRARLVGLFVHPVLGAAAAAAPAVIGAMRESSMAVAADLRRQALSEGAVLGVDVEFVEREGNPFTEIVRLADELRVDALVVGASTQAGHRFVGSLAIHLVKTARWPVTVVP